MWFSGMDKERQTVLLWTTDGWRSRLTYSSLLGMMNVIKHRPATVSSWPVL